MVVLGLMLVVGIVVTLSWGGITYRLWDPVSVDDIDHGETDDVPGSGANHCAALRPRGHRRPRRRFLGGCVWWVRVLPVPVIMRLLAVTGGDDAQGRITEADEVVGSIELDGTIGLYLFGGILPGLMSRTRSTC